jgi:hypothetical protein
LVPAVITLIVAVAGTAGIAFTSLGPDNHLHGGGDAKMITAAAVSSAGAIQIPSEPTAG